VLVGVRAAADERVDAALGVLREHGGRILSP